MASVAPRSESASAVRSRLWRERNPERYLANNRKNASEWYRANKKRALEYRRHYRATKPELVRAQLRKWRDENQEYVRAFDKNKHARRKGAPGSYTHDDIQALFASQGGLCVYCKQKLSQYHVDHIQPISRGGHNNPANLQLLCPPCNLSKGAKDPIDFAQERGLLL